MFPSMVESTLHWLPLPFNRDLQVFEKVAESSDVEPPAGRLDIQGQ